MRRRRHRHLQRSASPEEAPQDVRMVPESSLYEREAALAQNASRPEMLEPAPTPSASDMDPALRLQDAPSNWAGAGDVEPIGTPDPDADPGDPEAEPYVPLADSGGQGL